MVYTKKGNKKGIMARRLAASRLGQRLQVLLIEIDKDPR
jgi:hypothetical protein